MKINQDSQSEDIRIEIIPLIDVIFCILTFFILAALQFTRQQAISVDLPQASSSTTPKERQMLIVSINPFNQIYVENQLVLPDELEQKLREYRQANPDGMMVLYASRTAFYNDVVQILDKMRLVGGDRVALATLPDSTNQNSVSGSSTPNTTNNLTPGLTPGLTPNPSGITPPGTLTPGLTPYPGTNPYNPYNPYAMPNPGQSQLSPNSGVLPGNPGINPAVPGSGVLTPTLPPTGGVPEPPTNTEPKQGANSGTR